MFKRLFSLFILMMVGLPQLQAYIHPKQCEWVFDAEFLYLLPSIDDTYYVLQGTTLGVPNGDRFNNDFRFKPGFRVGALFGIHCGAELQVYYTRFTESRNKTVAGNNLWAGQGSAEFAGNFGDYSGFATSYLALKYQQADALLAFELCGCCPFHAYFQGGLDYADFSLNETYTYNVPSAGDLGIVDRQNKTWGIGPQFGFEMDFDLCEFYRWSGKLSFIGACRGALLASQSRENEADVANDDIAFAVNDRKTWRVIPTMHTKLGVNYLWCCQCFSAALEVGYEFTSYFRGITRTISTDDISEATIVNHYTNFDLQGLYVALDISF